MPAVVVGAAGGAELYPIASLDAKAGGGFALTSPILRINVFLCRHIVTYFCTVYRDRPHTFLSIKLAPYNIELAACVAYETVDKLPWSAWMRSRHRTEVAVLMSRHTDGGRRQ